MDIFLLKPKVSLKSILKHARTMGVVDYTQ